MSVDDQSTLLVQLENQNRALLTEIKSWSIDSDYLTTTDGFSFTCHASDLSKVRGLALEPVELKVNGASQMLGRIDGYSIGNDGQAVSYHGRDYLADMVECDVDPRVSIKEGDDLFTVITSVANTVGIDTVLSDGDLAMRDVRTGKSVTSRPGKSFVELKAEDVEVGWGKKQFSFLSPIVARHGATIQPANSRNAVMLSAPNYGQEPSYRLSRQLNGAGNNIISATATGDFSRFPTFALYNGSKAVRAKRTLPSSVQLAIGRVNEIAAASALGSSGLERGAASLIGGLYQYPDRVIDPGFGGTKTYNTANAAAGFAPSAEELILRNCHIGRRPITETGDPLKLYRLLTNRDDVSKNQEQLDRLAVREVGEILKDTLIYECEVQGHFDSVTGAIWSVDTMVTVYDEVCDVSEDLWIAARTLSYDSNNGARTSLTCWRPGAFVT